MIVAIDPGANSGCAILEGGKIRIMEFKAAKTAEHVRAIAPGTGTAITIVGERPKIYPHNGSNKNVDPNNLIPLYGEITFIQGMLIGMGYKVKLVTFLPHTWKGSVPKEIHQYRLKKKAEGLYMEPGAKVKGDCFDALGILIYYLTGEGIEKCTNKSIADAIARTEK